VDYDEAMFITLLPLLIGCPEYQPTRKVDDAPGEGPAIEVSPESLDFGLLNAGETASATFTITSVGTTALDVSELRVASSTFVLPEAPYDDLLLAPGESLDVPVVYTARNLADVGWVSIFSDDPLRPEARVQLSGATITAAIALDPPSLDFGSVARGDTAEGTIDIVNVGTASLVVSDVSVTGDGFGMATGWGAATTIAPGERLPVPLTFSPPASGVATGTMWVSSDAPSPLVSAPLSGASGRPVAVCRADPPEVAANAETSDLIGTASYDPEGGTITSWTWTMVSRPPGSGAVLPARSGAIVPNFAPDLAGVYEFALVVENDAGLASEACIATVDAIPSQDLWVELSWDHSGDDMDLHLLEPGGSLTTESDCYYANCVGGGLDWGRGGEGTDNPRLDLDDIPGTGPENINIASPADGVYEVYVHDYPGSRYTPENTYRVRIYLGGRLAWEGEKTLLGEDIYDPVAEILWPEGVVNPL
jgi:hypothetical protein